MRSPNLPSPRYALLPPAAQRHLHAIVPAALAPGRENVRDENFADENTGGLPGDLAINQTPERAALAAKRAQPAA